MYTLCVIVCISGYSMSVWTSYVAMFTIGHKDVVKIPGCKSMQSSLLLTGSTVAISLGRPKRVKGFSLKSLQLKILWCNQLWALSAGVTGRAIQ